MFVLVDYSRIRCNRQLPIIFQEVRLGLRQDDNTSATLAGSSGTADTVHILVSTGREPRLHHETDVRKVHSAAYDV